MIHFFKLDFISMPMLLEKFNELKSTIRDSVQPKNTIGFWSFASPGPEMYGQLNEIFEIYREAQVNSTCSPEVVQNMKDELIQLIHLEVKGGQLYALYGGPAVKQFAKETNDDYWNMMMSHPAPK